MVNIVGFPGVLTGTVACAASLNNSEFPGECVPVFSKKKRCIVYKSHMYGNRSMTLFHRAIILIRNPFDCIKTQFQFLYGVHESNNTKNTRGKNDTRPLPEVDRNRKDPFHALVNPSLFQSEGTCYLSSTTFGIVLQHVTLYSYVKIGVWITFMNL